MEDKNKEAELRRRRKKNKYIRRRKRQMRNRRILFYSLVLLIIIIILLRFCKRKNDVDPNISTNENMRSAELNIDKNNKVVQSSDYKIGSTEINLSELVVTMGNFVTKPETTDDQYIYTVKNLEAEQEILNLITESIVAEIPEGNELKDIISDYVQISFNDSTYLEVRNMEKARAQFPDINIDGEYYYTYLYDFDSTNHVSNLKGVYLSKENLKEKIQEILNKYNVESKYNKVGY